MELAMDPGVTCTRAAASDEHKKTENTKGQEEQTLHKTLKRAKTRVTHVSTCSRKDSLCRSVGHCTKTDKFIINESWQVS